MGAYPAYTSGGWREFPWDTTPFNLPNLALKAKHLHVGVYAFAEFAYTQAMLWLPLVSMGLTVEDEPTKLSHHLLGHAFVWKLLHPLAPLNSGVLTPVWVLARTQC